MAALKCVQGSAQHNCLGRRTRFAAGTRAAAVAGLDGRTARDGLLLLEAMRFISGLLYRGDCAVAQLVMSIVLVRGRASRGSTNRTDRTREF
jgi:hypothetical protein